MDGDVLLRFFLALVFTLSLIGLLYWLVRRYVPSRMLPVGGTANRLQILEVRSLDARRKLVLVRRDSVDHLLLLGSQSDLVIESGIRDVNNHPRAHMAFRGQVDQQQPSVTSSPREAL